VPRFTAVDFGPVWMDTKGCTLAGCVLKAPADLRMRVLTLFIGFAELNAKFTEK
jgi:hypothetical protein